MCFALQDIGDEFQIVSTRHECPNQGQKGISSKQKQVIGDISKRVHLAIPEGSKSDTPENFFHSGWISERK